MLAKWNGNPRKSDRTLEQARELKVNTHRFENEALGRTQNRIEPLNRKRERTKFKFDLPEERMSLANSYEEELMP